MMLFCAFMTLVTAVMLLALLFQDLASRKARSVAQDYAVDAFFLIGFLCTLVLAVHELLATLR